MVRWDDLQHAVRRPEPWMGTQERYRGRGRRQALSLMRSNTWSRGLISLLCGLTLAGLYLGDSPAVAGQEPQMPRRTIEQVQETYQNRWMRLAGVVGVGIGALDGKPVLKVLVVKKTPELEQKIPPQVEGYPVVLEETGTIRALPQKPATKP